MGTTIVSYAEKGWTRKLTRERNSRLLDKSIRSTLWAAILTSVAPILASLVDGLFAGNLLGQDAFSAISLVIPVVRIVTVLILICHMGGNILAAKCLGAMQKETAQKYFTLAITLSVAVGTIAAAVTGFGSGRLASRLSADSNIAEIAARYIRVISLNFILVAFSSTLNFFISGEGHPGHTSRIVIISSAVNVVLDYVFMGLLGLGVEGAAWGTVIASAVNVAMHIPFLAGGKSNYRLVRTGSETRKMLRASLTQGFAFNIINITLNVFLIYANALMSEQLGTADFYQWAICLQMQMFMICVCSGSVSGALYLGNTLLGEGDYYGAKHTVDSLLRLHIVFYAFLVVLMTALPGIFTFIFGIRTAGAAAACRLPFFCFSLYFMGYCFTCAYTNVFQMMGYVKAKIAFIVAFAVVVALCIGLGARLSVTWMWLGFPIGTLLVVGASLIFAYAQHRKDPTLTRFTLQRLQGKSPRLDRSSGYDEESLSLLLSDIRTFLYENCGQNGISEEIFNALQVQLRDVATSCPSSKKETFDYRMAKKNGQILVLIKYSGKSRRPNLKVPNAVFEYKYVFGLNVRFFCWTLPKLSD